MSYFLAFLGFAVLIILHEAGHFLAAKAVGMRVERFSLFFGPMFVKKQIGETEYGIGVIPLGGYVKITGMSPHEKFETPEIEARAYVNQPPWKRIVVIAAGPAVNLLLAFAARVVRVRQQSDAARHAAGFADCDQHGRGAHQGLGGRRRAPRRRQDRLGRRGQGAHSRSTRRSRARAAPAARTSTAARRQRPPRSSAARRRAEDGDDRPRWSTRYKEMLIGFTWNDATVPTGVIGAAKPSVAGLWRVTKKTVSAIANIFHSRTAGSCTASSAPERSQQESPPAGRAASRRSR